MNSPLDKREAKFYSQFGEDGITIELIKAIYEEPRGSNCLTTTSDIDLPEKVFLEVGVEDGRQCNTKILRERWGWNGLSIDNNNENPSINLVKEWVSKENIVQILKENHVPKNINYLSIDIDGNDFYVLKEILEYLETDIIVCEYNGSHLPDVDAVIEYDPVFVWDKTDYAGASLLAMKKLMDWWGYSLIYCTSFGLNAFFINNRLLNNFGEEYNIGNIEKLYVRPMHEKAFGIENSVNGFWSKDQRNRKWITSEEAMDINDE